MIEIKHILSRMKHDVGTDGMALAHALTHGYAAIGRGIRGPECISYLTDLTLAGLLRIEHNSWIYLDPHGTRIVGGSLGDRVVPGVARMGELVHARRGYCEIDRHELAEKIAFSAVRVQREIAWRNMHSTVATTRSGLLYLHSE